VAELSARDGAIVDFEGVRWNRIVAKEQAALELFGLTATRYAQTARQVMLSDAAEAYAPGVVRRWRALRVRRGRGAVTFN
jgi:hypothetical protein